MDALAEAQSLYRESLDATREQRQQIEEDLKFSDPSDPQQWDDDIKRRRENDPGGRRPCLVHDQTGQFVANVAGQVETQPPSIHAIPVGGGADKKAAEQIDGRFRHIEHASNAHQHYARALTSAARSGVGYIIIRPEYVDRALNWQEPRISSEPDPLRVVYDPWSTATNGKDATFGFILTDLSHVAFKQRWGKKDLVDFGEEGENDTRKSVLIAEQFYQQTKTREILIYAGPDGEKQSGEVADFEQAQQEAQGQLQVVSTYKDKYQCVQWRIMSGADVLEESEFPASSIGIVPVYGYVSFSDGRIKYCGIPRRARAPQQAYNYHISEQLAYIATAPKSPWLVPHRALVGQGIKELWDAANAESRAYLPYSDVDDQGSPVQQPTRINPSTSLINHEAGAQAALRDIQASIGMYQANLGERSNETSGVAIEARKQQGEASTAHFPSHLAASLGQVGEIVLEMDAKLADTRREVATMSIDGTPAIIGFDPEQPTAFFKSRDGITVNPSKGKYGVRVVVGASYSTQRSQTNQAFAEIMRGNKELAATVAPFWAQTLDFPGADKFAQAMAAMAPPPVKAILQPDDNAPDPAELMAQVQQLQQALQEATQIAQETQQDADQAEAEAKEAKALAAAKAAEIEIKAYEAETKRLQATGASEEQARAVVNDLIQQMLSNPDPMPGEVESAEPPEPEGPSQELQLIMQMQEQMAQGQAVMADAISKLAEATSRPRKRTPVRDKKTGDILYVQEE